MNLKGLSPVTDYFIIATGTSDRQLRTTADDLLELAKQKYKITPYGMDGYEQANWILIDFIDVVVHLFSSEYRNIYDLELLWGDAPRVRWQEGKKKKRTEK